MVRFLRQGIFLAILPLLTTSCAPSFTTPPDDLQGMHHHTLERHS